ncbi:hypothetical protein [Pseudobdellovibrio exovorus]|uniref:Glycoside hydrolase family 57 N-terminal domain-containing protein n=1 Tax=Pseudobdellovibrio exovorus JSS TaxID=1184267 RepID=M4VCM6_9BACT|nr:hypothetical protein [Pseudobdellovibrio exovorus]AGH95791.1 hypothetical protein A11Q_1575 [Pseudobdellovibrio exovorus JSS]
MNFRLNFSVKFRITFLSLLAFASIVFAHQNAEANLKKLRYSPDLSLVTTDMTHWLQRAGLSHLPIKIEFLPSSQSHRVRFSCSKSYQLTISASEEEMISTAYYGLRQLGFLFPHPRWQIIPTQAEVLKKCGQLWTWEPSLRLRGFHLHTQHAGEWTDGFFMDQSQIAQDTIWWLARNQQNVIQLQTLRLPDKELQPKLKPTIELAHQLGIHYGLSFSFAMIQQKNFYLIPFWRAVLGIGDEQALRQRIRELMAIYDFDFVASELGTTEFTSINEENSLKWIEILNEELQSQGRSFYVKLHVSTNQYSAKYGNFHFLPRFSSATVGIQPHTVFFYGLTDPQTPMYGRFDFADMRSLMLEQKDKRDIMYFPETSYYIGMDIDVPLFLTDYLVARADDLRFLKKNGFDSQVNFSTGQELGYWLFDWTLALLTDSQLQQNPLAGLNLLGEDTQVWEPILKWQTQYLKNYQLIQALSSANLMDDLYPFFEKTHERKLLRELRHDPQALESEIGLLQNALNSHPSLAGIKNTELKLLLEVTQLRLQHALKLRLALQALQNKKADATTILDEAKKIRLMALDKMGIISSDYNRYPESFVFSKRKNPTSYPYGYGWPAAQLHFWEREENMIRKYQLWNPFYMNIYNPFRLLL